jgi:hypothetical protein
MSKLQTPEEIEELQIKGIEQAMDAYDWRYPVAGIVEWDLLLTGGKVITIHATPRGATLIEQASERYGDDTLFLIRVKGAWS